jgi:hypothetical protein
MPQNSNPPDADSESADQAWLDGLRGESPADADPASLREVQALRGSLQARRDRLQAATPEADGMLLDQIRFRIRREQADRVRPWSRVSFWGLAASLVLGVAVVFQVAGPGLEGELWGKHTDAETMRGASAKGIVQLADDPQARRDQLVAVLKKAGAEPLVKEDRSKGEVTIRVQATQAVLDSLGSDELRIYPEVQDGWITLILKPTKPRSGRP